MSKHCRNAWRRASLCALGIVLMCSGAQAADARRTPAAIIAALSDRIYVLGETTGNVSDMNAAEAKAAEEIRRYIASGANDGLLAAGKGKQSPLATAAYMGYPNVVAALLTSAVVRSHVNEADANGMTPWVASTLSMQQSAAACNAGIFENPYAFIPLLVTQAYYAANPAPPYRATRELLERAGAAPDIARARQVWDATCKHATADAKARVQTAPDVQAAVQELGVLAFAAQLQELQKKRRQSVK